MKRASLWLVALLAGCSFSDEKRTIDEARADQLVLQREDVDPHFRQTWVRNLGGRPGSEVLYRRSYSPTVPGPFRIRSRADVLRSADDADERLGAARDALGSGAWQPIAEPGLGDESFAATVVQGGVRRYDVAWRGGQCDRNVERHRVRGRSSVGRRPRAGPEQQRRLEAAAHGEGPPFC